MKYPMNKITKRRILLSFSNFLFFFILSATGALLFITPFNSFISGLHIWVAISFTLLIIFHVITNTDRLIAYFKTSVAKLVIASCLFIIIAIAISVYYRLPPFSSVLVLSNQFKRTATIEEGEYQIIRTENTTNGNKITIDVKAGKYYRDHSSSFYFGLILTSPPQMAFWLEDMDGNFIKTLYATRKTSYPAIYSDYIFRSDTIKRPEALPYWFHKKQRINKKNSIKTDAISGATPHGHYEIQTYSPKKLQKFRILAEINRSFDFNGYYTKEKFPEDLIYSGDGYPGQPSVIYASDIDLKSKSDIYFLKPIGHGHHSGANGKLYKDMTGIDTALKIIQRIIVEVGH